MKTKNKKISATNLDRFLKDLEDNAESARVQELFSIDKSGNTNVNYRHVARDLVKTNTQKFSTLFSVYEDGVSKRKIERLYSRNEIRKMVWDNLITEYRKDPIIEAVTQYLYGVHVAK